MGDADRLRSWLEAGPLVGPDASALSSVDLIQAVLQVAGLSGPAFSRASRSLIPAVSGADHIALILIDGLGSELLHHWSPSGFLREHQVRDLRSVFPSTTAAALTSLATACYPAEHGVTGWWIYLRQRDLTATVLPFRERFTGRDLREWGVTEDEVFLVPSALSALSRDALTVVPNQFLDDVYLRYSTGGTASAGYGEPGEAIELLATRIADAREPTYTYLYFPQLDTLAHARGVDDPEVGGCLAAFEHLISQLHGLTKERARLIVTADHGMVSLPAERSLFLDEGDELQDWLACPPSGEPTLPYFHLNRDDIDGFRTAFHGRFGDAFVLITPAEAEELALFGPGPLSTVARARLGDLIGIAAEPTALYFRRAGDTVQPNRGVHAGLRRGEMLVPLIVA